jgi:hypothetical protein
MAQRGGRRPGAGRKPDPELQEFREWLRGKFNTPAGRKKLWARAWKSDVILAKLLDKSVPTPTELDININRIPSDFTFRCELTTRSDSPSPAPVEIPEGGHRGPGD